MHLHHARITTAKQIRIQSRINIRKTLDFYRLSEYNEIKSYKYDTHIFGGYYGKERQIG